MVKRILYFGSDLAACRSLHEGEPDDQRPDLITTTRLDVAINQLKDTELDGFLIDETTDRSHLSLLVRTAKTIDPQLPVVYRGPGGDLDETELSALIDETIGSGEPFDLDALGRGGPAHDRSRVANDPVIEAIHNRRARRTLAHVGRDGTYLWANDRMAKFVGTEPAGLRGASLAAQSPVEDPESLMRLLDTAVEAGTVQWTRDVHDPDGPIFCIYPLGADTALLVGYPPESSLAYGAKYLNRLKEIFFIVDFDGEFVYWNNSLNQVTGYDDAELRNMTAFELFSDAERDKAEERLQEVAVTGEQTVELQLRTMAGESIPYEFSGSLIEGQDGTPRYVCGIGRDISRRVAMREELDSAIERLEESNADLERFAYVASHDLREPLRMVRSYLQLLERRYGDELDEDAQEFIEFAVDGAERMQTMMKDLLEYSRVGTEVAHEPVDCNEVIEDVRSNLQVSIDESGAEITRDDLPVVAGDRTLLVQLFQNLLANAIEHRTDGTPRVHITAERQANRWEFAVRDQNEGIARVDDDIFELFSSGPDNDGFGIGLATCRKIVETFDGAISVESEDGVGSTFRFTLPSAETG